MRTATDRRQTESEQPNIADGWAARSYDGINSFLNRSKPAKLQRWLYPHLRDGIIAWLVESTAHRHPLRRVVDLGCGVGDWTTRYLDFADQVTGVDVNGAFLAEARVTAAAHRRADRLSLHQLNMREFDGYEGADLVCLGACPQYLGDAELDEVMTAIAASQQRGDFIYLRATCAHDHRRPVANHAGFYRRKAAYEGHLQRLGYRILDRRFNSTLLLAHLMRRLGIRSFPVARRVASPINAMVRATRLLTDRNDFVNWIAVRG